MKSIKQILFASVALLYCLTVSGHDFERGGIYYNFPQQQDLADPVVTVTYRGNYHDSYRNEYQGSVKIPSTVNYWGTTYRVVGIEDGAFYECEYLTSVIIPYGITKIGDQAFEGCIGLTSMSIPESVTSIGSQAFSYCESLTSISLPEYVRHIGEAAFYNCYSLTSITIPEFVRSIEQKTFEGCSSLTSINLPMIFFIKDYAFKNSGLTSIILGHCLSEIGEGAFQGCRKLSKVINVGSDFEIRKGSKNNGEIAYYAESVINAYGAVGEYYFTKQGNVYLLSFYTGKETKPTLPESFYEKNYRIGAELFKDNNRITAVSIPQAVEGIGAGAFANCSKLTSVKIGKGVRTIGKGAFSGCSNLTSIKMEDGLLSIDDNAFENCTSLTSITFPESLKAIDRNAFKGCSKLFSFNMPANMNSIESSAFEGCSNLTKVNVSSIQNWCKIIFGNALANPLYYANKIYINGELAVEITIPKGVTKIRKYAFYNCRNLTSVSIHDGVKEIGERAFEGCNNLSSINIPQSVTAIENFVFKGCASLSKVVIEDGDNTLSLGFNSFENGSKPNYSNIGVYSMDVIGEGLFHDCPLETIYLGRNVEYNTDGRYGYSPFYNKATLESITIGDKVTKIGDYEFSDCRRITSINLPKALSKIGICAFKGCHNLTYVNIPKKVNEIKERAFEGCPNLISVFIDDVQAWCRIRFSTPNANPLYYGKNLFLNGDIVTKLIIPEGTTKIEKWAFYGCNSLANVIIPPNVGIGDCAFKGCRNLKFISVPEKKMKALKSAFGEEKHIVVNGKKKKYKL